MVWLSCRLLPSNDGGLSVTWLNPETTLARRSDARAAVRAKDLTVRAKPLVAPATRIAVDRRYHRHHRSQQPGQPRVGTEGDLDRMRCTTLLKLLATLSGGTSADCPPKAGGKLSIPIAVDGTRF